jgi:glycosyltransferase involved in cell wall biosynthesis
MQLVADLEVGGAQEVVCVLAEHLTEQGCSTLVCTFCDGPLRKRLEAAGVPVKVVHGRRHTVLALPLFLVDMFRIARTLAGLVREYRIDIVQTHLLRSLDFLVLLLLWVGTLRAVFWTFHSVEFELSASDLESGRWLLGAKKSAHRLLYRAGARWVSGMIAVSDDVKRSMEAVLGRLGGKVSVIHNGVDIRRYWSQRSIDRVKRELGLDPNVQVVVTVGRLARPKGHKSLIEAWRLASPALPDAHLLIVGDGELRFDLQEQVKCLGLGARCHFLGVREDVPDLLAAAELFVLPSLWEGMSVALLEAMAAGRPVVATAVSGTGQVMLPGKTGLVVPPADSQALADAMVALLTNRTLARDMGKAARRIVEREFSAEQQAARHVALYEAALHQEGLP